VPRSRGIGDRTGLHPQPSRNGNFQTVGRRLWGVWRCARSIAPARDLSKCIKAGQIPAILVKSGDLAKRPNCLAGLRGFETTYGASKSKQTAWSKVGVVGCCVLVITVRFVPVATMWRFHKMKRPPWKAAFSFYLVRSMRCLVAGIGFEPMTFRL
jgi:hypothetical protein